MRRYILFDQVCCIWNCNILVRNLKDTSLPQMLDFCCLGMLSPQKAEIYWGWRNCLSAEKGLAVAQTSEISQTWPQMWPVTSYLLQRCMLTGGGGRGGARGDNGRGRRLYFLFAENVKYRNKSKYMWHLWISNIQNITVMKGPRGREKIGFLTITSD